MPDLPDGWVCYNPDVSRVAHRELRLITCSAAPAFFSDLPGFGWRVYVDANGDRTILTSWDSKPGESTPEPTLRAACERADEEARTLLRADLAALGEADA